MGIRTEELKNIDFSDIATGESLPVVTPGDVLQDYLDGAGITVARLAQATHLPQTRISNILQGRHALSADTALRLGRFFSTTPQFWMNLQSSYDLEIAEHALAAELEDIRACGA
ncbi:HigA family addiction module antitoxin [Halochromatium salexigens]|uniref:Addiction module antidote protein, HigA family n=1 Tax=Halochromatium salexigens TaxID=49447 RepID=A0AAJ0XH79_HALSE|nr:HigA family addiction module antitoxin [Halochromatium salexigens]MBK5931425.1 addiction module antidote protein, HigA family [Halochromatium salexigens]